MAVPKSWLCAYAAEVRIDQGYSRLWARRKATLKFMDSVHDGVTDLQSRNSCAAFTSDKSLYVQFSRTLRLNLYGESLCEFMSSPALPVK